ncbi:hypothetical protein [Sulfurospirillum sp. hDNRA2]|uniref:hypothetical protein n=1 Tax=Sulfurospirillum sp. hDNRA2 TaxID=3237298 RepID=UPI00339D3981
MKTVLSIIAIACTIVAVIEAKSNLTLNDEVKTYDTIFEKIAEKRIGANIVLLDTLGNPFVSLSSDLNVSEHNASSKIETFTLEATFEAKAKINGVWYGKNDDVGAYKLVKITRNSALLQNDNDKKELFIRTKDESNVKIFAK